MVTEIMHSDRTTSLGVVRINNDAVMSIASIAVMEVKGVYRMGGSVGKALFTSIFRKGSPRGVRIQMKGNEVKLTVYIVVEYGVDIPRIADEVQENVKRAIENMAGFVFSEVDVVVEGVQDKKRKEGK